MCGVAGYVGLGHLPDEQRFDLVEALGIGIDRRGGDAAGYVSVSNGIARPLVRLGRKLDEWSDARGRFLRAASAGHSAMLHARFTTSGNSKDIECAHPFPIRRERGVVLYGCHNGMLEGTVTSAKTFGRTHTVDSREFLELLADKQYETIRKLDGYGVVTYVKPSDGIIRVVRISKDSDFEVVALEGGGIVYASTMAILKEGLDFAGLSVERKLSVSEVGRVYRLTPKDATETRLGGIEVDTMWTRYCGGMGESYYGRDQLGFDKRFTEESVAPPDWSYTYKKLWSSKLKRWEWVPVSTQTGEVLEETGFIDPGSAPESESKVPSEPPSVQTPPDFDEEQAEQWEQFWKENQHLLNDRSDKS